MDPAAQQQLLGAWHGLLGTAVHLVHALQAAQWDGGNSSSSRASSAGGINGSSDGVSGSGATSSSTADVSAGSKPPSASAAIPIAAVEATELVPSSTTAAQQRLRQLEGTLRSALDPNHDMPDAAATAALEEIEALATQTQTVGSDTDALMKVLAGQGIALPGSNGKYKKHQ